MTCLDVMYHQSYGAHYLSASPAAAAVAYKAAYCHHHHQQQQQKKRSMHSKMQEYVDQHLQQQQQQQGTRPPQHHWQAGGGRDRLAGDQGLRRLPEGAGSGGLAGPSGSVPGPALKDGGQPTEAEYLNSRCVLFTYFHGDIGDVVDEHFSRALSQPSAFTMETKMPRSNASAGTSSTALWKDALPLCENQSVPSTLWNTAYPSQASPCLSSVSVHPDFSPSPLSFHPTDGALWMGHPLSQPGLPPPGAVPDTWAYSLSPQAGANYPHVHEVYPHPHPHTHTHMHPRHPALHPHPGRGPALDPRFSPLLLRSHPAHSPGTHGPPHGEGLKAEMDPSCPNSSPVSTATAASWPLHGAPLDAYDSALDQDKLKASVWF